MHFKRFYEELKRRNVFRVGIAYAVAGWLIIQVSDTVFPRLGFPDWTITFMVVVVGLGFPIALIIAWAFELTPEGLKKSDEVDIEQSITSQTGRKINRVAIISLSLVIILLLTERVFFAGNGLTVGDRAEIGQASIAVLPFLNMSPDPNNEYFSDGLSEELLNVLAKVEDLKVAGRTSSFKFKGQNDDLKMIGQELGVDHLLEGSVRKAGDKIRITVQLIKVEDGYHMWSETYDRELTDIFEIQDEISRKVLSELKVRLLDDEGKQPVLKVPTQDLEAYQVYLRANHLMLDRQVEKMQTAVELYENAIDLDPTFAEAYARLAIAHHLIAYYGVGDFEEKQRLLKDNAETAISLNDELGIAYGALGLYHSTIDNQLSSEYYLKSLELNENQADVYGWLGNNYEVAGLTQKRDEVYMKMYEIDPLAPLSMYNRARVHLEENEFDKAEALLRKSIRLNPGFTSANRLIAQIWVQRDGRYDQALISVHQAIDDDNPSVVLLSDMVINAFELGMTDIVKKYREELGKEFPQSREYGIATSLYSILTKDTKLFENAILAQIQQYNITVQEVQFYGSLYAYVGNGGDPEKVKPEFIKYAPGILSDTLRTLDPQQYQVAGPLIGILYRSGEIDQYEKLREAYCAYEDQINEQGEASRGRAFNKMLCHLSAGELDAAFPFFKSFYTDIKRSNFDFYILENATMITNAMSDPRYLTIRDEVRADIENQREKVREYFAGLEGE